MVGSVRHDFPQEAPPTPFKTVLLSDLELALVAKRLHNHLAPEPRRKKVRGDWHGDGPFVWARRPRHPLIKQAEQWAALQIRGDLQAGLLTAYMPTDTAGIFLRIKPKFWDERRSDIRVDGMLFDLDQGALLPDEIDEQSFCVFEQCAQSWLTHRRISDDNPAFPAALRTTKIVKIGQRPSDEQIVAEALRLKSKGARRDEIAKEIRKIPGFKGVGNVLVRDLIAGKLPRGRPRKATT
ncbi:hypothetical protein [Sphingopyxis alaskensis]|uniref:hypothetical protein n=1 Tax=Sphingopyxis alaskensis TaxID=117207 RepID=UPI00391CE134